MTDLVKCDRCGTPFSIQTAGIRATWSGDYMVQYFTCPGCHHRYQILTTDTELRQTIQRHKAIAAKIKLGQTKHFRPGTLKKYQAEMEKLEAEQKKRRDELLDKANEILAQLGEEQTMGDLKEYPDRLKFEIMAADFLTTEDREMVFDLIEKVLGDDNA